MRFNNKIYDEIFHADDKEIPFGGGIVKPEKTESAPDPKPETVEAAPDPKPETVEAAPDPEPETVEAAPDPEPTEIK